MMDEKEVEDARVADSALQNLEEAIRIGRTDVIVRTLDLAGKHLHDGEAGVVTRILNRSLADGNSCLHLAVVHGHVDAIRALLRAGTNPALRNNNGKTAYELASTEQLQMAFTSHVTEAIALGNLATVEQVLSSGLPINQASKADQYNTLLHWACRCSTLPTVKYLMSRNAKLSVVNGDGLTPLHEAVRRWNVPVIEFLLDSGADPDKRVEFGPHAGCTARELVPPPQSWSALQIANGCTSPSPSLPPLIHHSGSESMETTGAPPVATATSSAQASHEQMDNHPLRILWPPPAVIRCVDARGFPLDDALPAEYHLADSTESFVDALDVFMNAMPMFGDVGKTFAPAVHSAGCPLDEGRLVYVVNPDLFTTRDSYALTISEERINLQASDLAGLWYGLQTLAQICRLCAASKVLPALYIRDWPDLQYRGFMVDLMQGRLPTLESLKVLIMTMSSLKMNMLQLRMGAVSFAYAGLEELWKDEECYTSSDMLHLSTFAKKHFVSLVPHQDSLALAAGIMSQTGQETSVRDVASTMAGFHRQLFACFPDSKFAHVGLDQPPKSAAEAQDASDGGDFEDLLWTMHSSCRLHRRSMQMWGSELQVRTALVPQLPSSVIVMQPLGQFTLEKNAPFCRSLVQAGANIIVCPDSMGKNSVSGRPHTSMAQLVAVAQCALHYRAMGMLLTDFADFGHVHPLIATTVPLVSAAGLAWRAGTPLTHLQEHVPSVINHFVLMDEAEIAGHLLLDLQLIHSALLCPTSLSKPSPMLARSRAASSGGGGVLSVARSNPGSIDSTANGEQMLHDTSWWQPIMSWIALRPEKFVLPPLTGDSVQSAIREVRHCQAVLANLRMTCPQSTAVVSELSFILELFMFVCRAVRQMLLSNRASGNAAECLAGLSLTSRTDLANRLISLAQLYSEAWMSRNMQGSMDKGVAFFQRTLALLRHDAS